MSLYNLSKISSSDPVVIMQGLNSYADGLTFTIITFAIALALFIGIYLSDTKASAAMAFTGFGMMVTSSFLWFVEVVPIWLPFVFVSMLVIGIFMGVNDA